MGTGSRRIITAVLLAPAVALLGIFFLYPLVRIAIQSFTTPHLGFGNYIEVLKSTAVHRVTIITLTIAIETVIVCLIMAFPYAYYMTKSSPRVRILLLAFSTAPLWTATIVRLYAWTLILGRRGLVNSALMKLGLIDRPLDLLFNKTAVVIGMVHVMLPFMILILYSAISRIDRAVIAAAETLGASPFRIFTTIILPLSRSGIYAGSLLVAVISIGFYITPAVLGGGSATTVSLYIQNQVQLLQWGPASALGMMLLVFTLIGFGVLDRFFGIRQALTGGVRK